MNVKELYAVAENLFTKKRVIDSLWQEVADNFYVERATFTISRSIGTDFASNLLTSYPILCRRDLGNQFGTMLRPTAKPWFHVKRRYIENESNEVKRQLEQFEKIQRRAMYDPISQFTRATKEGDHDFAAFGQCAISIELSHNSKLGSHLLYRCWHLRDMAWQEDENGKVETKFRKWKPTVQQLCRTFKNVHSKVTEVNSKTPFEEHEVIHMVVPCEMYDKKLSQPYCSIWYDPANDHIMEETGLWTGHYIIPRWQTVSGSQYSYSPATVAALPDARLLQAMTFTLLEAGEKATSPPMIATQDAIRSDVAVYAGGITWVDAEYDEKMGSALRPIEQDFRGFQYGIQMNSDSRAMIREAFFLNKLNMPERATEMTAYEVGQRVQEYIRNALPIFEPMEAEYNSALCDDSFTLLLRNGGFGNPAQWPRELLTKNGVQVDFEFESPLHDAIEQQKGHKILEVKALLADAAAVDPSVIAMIDTPTALRDALEGIQTPATWMRSKDDTDKIIAQQKQEAQSAAMLASMQQASEVAKNLGQTEPATA